MTRSLPLLAVVSAAVTIPALAAPVPKHLMPKDPPLPFPTTVGTTWVYVGSSGEQTIVISAVEDKDGAKLVTTEYVSADGKRSPHMVQYVSEKGLFLVAERGKKYDSSWCILKWPHREGDAWETQLKGPFDGRGTMTAGPLEKVKVPAGEFTAGRVEWELSLRNQPPSKSTYWYARGIGLVRLDDHMLLKSFTPGKP